MPGRRSHTAQALSAKAGSEEDRDDDWREEREQEAAPTVMKPDDTGDGLR